VGEPVLGEFELIERYFARCAPGDARVILGIGDDCALYRPRAGYDLAISTDMLLAGRHFFADTDPEGLGHKSLAVNLSDLAAMGAAPVAFTLGLALPKADPDWLLAFSRGLSQIAAEFSCPLVGGDTTRGPLAISITILGEVPAGAGVRRSGARPGDDIWVSGCLGGAALALRLLEGRARAAPGVLEALLPALLRPHPRVALGLALAPWVSAMIDLSDGLVGDLGHILERSSVGAALDVEHVPGAQALIELEPRMRLECLLAGGDDYELCFTALPGRRPAIEEVADRLDVRLSRIGSIEPGGALRLADRQGQPYRLPDGLDLTGFDHFG
jgi:thiamine-monophosphate kinase